MSTTERSTARRSETTGLAGIGGTIAMLAAGGLAIGFAVLLTTQDAKSDYESVGGIAREVAILAWFTTTMLAVVAAQLRGRAPQWPVRLIVVGYGLIALGVAAGLVLRDDPDWFFLLGGPGNLLAGIGFVWWGVSAWRGRLLPRWAAVLVAIGGFFAILFAEFGTSVLIGGFWIWLATRGALDRE